MSNRHKGTVLWFSTEKGYGFIQCDELGRGEHNAIFVHYSGIQNSHKFKKLFEADIVEFEMTKDNKGREVADNVVVLESPNRPQHNKQSNK